MSSGGWQKGDSAGGFVFSLGSVRQNGRALTGTVGKRKSCVASHPGKSAVAFSLQNHIPSESERATYVGSTYSGSALAQAV
jgi:hypothetical protein